MESQLWDEYSQLVDLYKFQQFPVVEIGLCFQAL